MKQLFSCTLLMAAVFLGSCNKNPGSPATSNLTGTVALLDANDHLKTTGIAGTTVTVENSNPLISTTTNSNGIFTLPDFSSNGTTVLAFSLPGYGTVKQFYTASEMDNIKSGNAELGSFILAPISTVVVNSFTGVLDGAHYRININVSVANTAASNGVTIFIEKNNPAVSCSNSSGNSGHSRVVTIPVTNGDNTYTICLTCTEECGFLHSGDIAYLRAYGDTKSMFGITYDDPLKGNLIFPALNTNNNIPAISFTMP